MKTELHPANERGHAYHGWLDTYFSFSFSTYFNPVRQQFGCLRVLNDDTISGGTGFDLHPHNNMEIITIMREGELEHRDSMGNIQVIRPGEIQVMSAGTGIYHAEYNHSATETVKLFQIWIFPRAKGLTPRYDQKLFDAQTVENQLLTLVTPDIRQQEDALWIHQDAYISMTKLHEKTALEYKVKIPGNGVFLFVMEGKSTVKDFLLNKRDAIAISKPETIKVEAQENSEILFIEIPMQ